MWFQRNELPFKVTFPGAGIMSTVTDYTKLVPIINQLNSLPAVVMVAFKSRVPLTKHVA